MANSDPYVKEMQVSLKNAGFYLDILDGIAGKNTVSAVNKAVAAAKQAQAATKEEPVVIMTNSDVVVKPLVNDQKSQYALSAASLLKLGGVKPDLVKVVKRAIQITSMDFAVNEGLRSLARQKQLKASGASQTLESNHLTGDAVDLVPTPNGKQNWNNWDNYYPMVLAMQSAAEELNIKIRWGGCWEIINNKAGDPKAWVEAYGARKRAEGKKAFTDGPHFELV